MAIVSVKRLFRETSSQTVNGQRQIVWNYLVKTDAMSDGPEAAEGASDGVTSIPAYGSAHPTDATCVVKSRVAQPISDDPFNFLVRVTFETIKGNASEEIQDPLERPWEYSVTADESTEDYFRDVDGNPLVNSAGQPLRQLLQRDNSTLVINLVYNYASFLPSVSEPYKNTLNAAEIIIKGETYPARKLKMSPITMQEVTEGSTTFYRVTYRIKYSSDGWDQVYEDRGDCFLSSGKLVPIHQQDGIQVPPEGWPLDGSGGMQTNANDPPSQIQRVPYADKDWSPLGLPAI